MSRPPIPQNRRAALAPVPVALLEGKAPQAGQIGPDPLAVAQELLLAAVADGLVPAPADH